LFKQLCSPFNYLHNFFPFPTLETWSNFRSRLGYHTPKVFHVNWFRESSEGKILWPGLAENSRVLKWICERIEGTGKVLKTPIGFVPAKVGGLDIRGLDEKPDLDALLVVKPEEWAQEITNVRNYYESLGDILPPLVKDQIAALEQRLSEATH
jgi:phosphoenolpyruvate carboxykinase (GTP)